MFPVFEVRKDVPMKTGETAQDFYAGEPSKSDLQQVAGKIRFSAGQAGAKPAAGASTMRAANICWCDCSCTCESSCSCSCSCDCSCICSCSCEDAAYRMEVSGDVPVDCACAPPVDCACAPPVDCACAPPVDCACAPPIDCACAPPVDCACAPPVDCACAPPVDCACAPPWAARASTERLAPGSAPLPQARFGDIEIILNRISTVEAPGEPVGSI